MEPLISSLWDSNTEDNADENDSLLMILINTQSY